MRVPSVGLTRDERHIVEEGYRLAERLMQNYQDPPGPLETVARWLADLRMRILARD